MKNIITIVGIKNFYISKDIVVEIKGLKLKLY